MIRILVAVALLNTSSAAQARPEPFASYHAPAAICDDLQVSTVCRAAELREWRKFVAGKLDSFEHITSVRLTDLFIADDKAVGGWVFRVVVPRAPSRWKPADLRITLGGM